MKQQPLLLHLIDELKPGGAQTALLTQLAGAVKLYPFRHRVLCLYGRGEIADRIEALGIEVEVLDLRPQATSRRYFEIIRILRKRIQAIKPDVVEAHLTWSRILGLPAAALARVPKRFGYEHGDIYLTALRWRIGNFIAQWAASSIVICSHALKEWMMTTYGVADTRIKVIHNCVDTATFGSSKTTAVKRSDFADRPGTILFCTVGTLGRGVDKRVDVAIDSLARARKSGTDVRLVVCGDGPQRGALEKLAARLGVADEVKFLGMRADVDHVLAVCDAFCHAAPFEPFGIVCIEAMWLERPVVVPASGGLLEIVDDGVNGLFYPPLDAQALAEKMILLARDPALRAKLGKAGRRKVQAEFTVETYLRKLYGHYGLLT